MTQINDNNLLTEVLNTVDGMGLLHKSNQGLDTYLGTEYFEDAIDLSGGEWQKLAIARALINNANIIIFDEATASLDANAEKEYYKLLKTDFANKTIIIVTHRIGVSDMVDRIIYLENGNICEDGSHNELISKKGKYFNLYKAQARWYSDETEVDS